MDLGAVYLLVSLLIFSSAGSVFTLLNDMDPDVFMPCNVLCSSNMIGAVLLSIFLRKDLFDKESYSTMTRSQWAWMLLGSVLYSVVGPYLYLTGLASTDVPTAAIIQRLESLNFLVLSYFSLNTHISRWTFCNAALTLGGIVLAVISPVFFGDTIEVTSGSLFILLAGYAFSASLLISKKYLSTVPVAILAVFRVLLGSVLYHILILALGEKIGRLYSAPLWIGMVPYGLVYVFLGQMCWLLALQKASALYVSIGTTLLFILSLIWAAVLLGEFPTTPQWIGSAVLTISIVSSVSEILHNHWAKSKEPDELPTPSEHGLLAKPAGDSAADISNATGAELNPILASLSGSESPPSPRNLRKGGAMRGNSCNSVSAGSVQSTDFDSFTSQGGGFKGF